jgi:hypothetical protein
LVRLQVGKGEHAMVISKGGECGQLSLAGKPEIMDVTTLTEVKLLLVLRDRFAEVGNAARQMSSRNLHGEDVGMDVGLLLRGESALESLAPLSQNFTKLPSCAELMGAGDYIGEGLNAFTQVKEELSQNKHSPHPHHPQSNHQPPSPSTPQPPTNTTHQPTQPTPSNQPFTQVQEELSTIRVEDLEVLGVLGEGAFGRVTMVRYVLQRSGGGGDGSGGGGDGSGGGGDGSEGGGDGVREKVMALKQMSKKSVLESGQLEQVLREKVLAQRISGHPFLLELYNTFQDDDAIYMLTNLFQGWWYISVECVWLVCIR